MLQLTFDYAKPEFAPQLLQRVVSETDAVLREESLSRSNEQLDYLRHQLDQVTNEEHREVLVEMIMSVERTRMLASGDLPFAATIVQPPFATVLPVWPKPSLYPARRDGRGPYPRHRSDLRSCELARGRLTVLVLPSRARSCDMRLISRTLAGRLPGRRAVFYVTLMSLAGAVSALKQFLYAKVIGPQEFGYYTLILLLSAYAIYLFSFGVSEGLTRQLSLLRSRAQDAAADGLRDRCLNAVMLAMALAWVISGAAVLVLRTDAALKHALVLVMPYTLFVLFLNVALIDLRTRRQTMPFAAFMLLRAGGMICVGGLAALWLGFAGAVCGEIAVQLAVFWAVLRFNASPFKLHLRPLVDVAQVVRVGLPFNVASFFRAITVNVDRWFVAVLFPIASFGIYSFAMTLVAGGLLVATMVGAVLEPHLIYRHASGEDARNLFRYGCRISLLLCLLMAAAAVPVLVGLQWVVPRFFPRYTEALPLFPVVYLGTSFYVMNVFDSVILAFGVGRQLMAVHAATAVAVGLVCIGLAYAGAPMIGFAAAFCLG